MVQRGRDRGIKRLVARDWSVATLIIGITVIMIGIILDSSLIIAGAFLLATSFVGLLRV